MITLNKIRELILKQDLELENMLREYFEQSTGNNVLNIQEYKEKTKKEIEDLLNNRKIDEANVLINKYKNEFKNDISIYSIEAISLIYQEKLEEAYEVLKNGLCKDSKNVDLLYNMAYLNFLMGDIKTSIHYYLECLENNEDEELKQEIINILEQLESSNEINKEYTFIVLGINKNDDIFYKLKKESENILVLEEETGLESNKRYIENDIVTYKVNNYEDSINNLIENNDNCVIVVNDYSLEKHIRNIKDKCKIIYYTNKNLNIDKRDYINNSVNLFLENQICNISDVIITSNVSLYNCKKIIENRNNIYFMDMKSNDSFNIIYLIENQEGIFNKDIVNNLSDYINNLNIDREYDKLLYSLSIDISNYDKTIEILKYLYNQYNTEEVYKMYLSLLCQNQEYEEVVQLMLESNFCEEIFKLEVLYLNSIKNFNLVEFIAQLSIKSYFQIEKTDSRYIEYKKACYDFEICNYLESYNGYLKLLNNSENFNESPMVNRNIAYLMYSNGNEDYKKYYSKYQCITNILKQVI